MSQFTHKLMENTHTQTDTQTHRHTHTHTHTHTSSSSTHHIFRSRCRAQNIYVGVRHRRGLQGSRQQGYSAHRVHASLRTSNVKKKTRSERLRPTPIVINVAAQGMDSSICVMIIDDTHQQWTNHHRAEQWTMIGPLLMTIGPLLMRIICDG